MAINGLSHAATPDHQVVIIGAGLTGLGVAADLQRNGVDDFLIVERAEDVGGTWRDNTYPGVGVDVPTFAYQFSFFLKPDWSRTFAKGHEVKQYIDDFVEHFDLKRRIRFGTEITTRTWDDANHLWRLGLVDGGELTARFVVFAVGAYIERRPAEFEGLDSYQGKVLEPTAWDHDYDLRGKRIAVVGTGATSAQIVPAIAPEVARLDVYQRTAIWILPKVDPAVPGWLVRRFERSPELRLASYRAANRMAEVTLVKMIVEYARIPILQRIFQAASRLTLRAMVKDRKLRRQLTPEYPFGAKRPSMGAAYWQAFNRDNVNLVTERIERFTPSGIRTTDGIERDADAVVLATGFVMAYDPAAYRPENKVTGRDGFDLGTRFATERLKAYEGLTMPGLPNHFMAFCGYSAVGGSWHLLVENMSRHILRLLDECERRGATRVEVKPEAVDRHHAMVLERVQGALMFHLDVSKANTYYLDHHGDATVMRPTSIKEAVEASSTFPLDDYEYASLADTAELAGEPGLAVAGTE